jgi:predicted ester cyclase
MYTRTNIMLMTAIGLLALCAPTVAQTKAELIAIRADFAAALDAHDLDAIVSPLADDFVFDWAAMPAPIVGPEGFRAFMEGQYAHSSDWHTDQGRVFATDEVVVVEHAARGTQTGPLAELPDLEPQGNPWAWYHVDIYDFEADKISRLTSYGDVASVYVQMGVMPAPEMPPLVPSFTVPDPEPTGLSPLEANAELLARWNAHDVAGMAKMFHADIAAFDSGLGVPVSREEYVAALEMMLQGFSDMTGQFTRVIDLGDGWVAVEVVFTGTHDGLFMGVPPTGRTGTVRAGGLRRFDADGLVTDFALYYDNLTIMTQLTAEEWPVDGPWITTVPTPMGNMIIKGIWTAQDAAQTRLSGEFEQINVYPLLIDLYPDSERVKFAGALAVKTGLNQYDMTAIEYFTKTVGPGHEEIVGLGVVSGNLELTGPDSVQGQGTGAYYLPSQDADQDGFPDEGQEPALCVPWTWTAKRLTLMPPCVPTPPVE